MFLGLSAMVQIPAPVPAIRYNTTLWRGGFHSCPAANRLQSTVDSQQSTDEQSSKVKSEYKKYELRCTKYGRPSSVNGLPKRLLRK